MDTYETAADLGHDLSASRAGSSGFLAAPACTARMYTSSARSRSADRASARPDGRRSARVGASADGRAHELGHRRSTRGGVLERRNAPGGFTPTRAELARPSEGRRARVRDRRVRARALRSGCLSAPHPREKRARQKK